MWDPAELTLSGFGSLSFIPSTLFPASLIFNLSLAVSAGEIPEERGLGGGTSSSGKHGAFSQGGRSIIQADPDVKWTGLQLQSFSDQINHHQCDSEGCLKCMQGVNSCLIANMHLAKFEHKICYGSAYILKLILWEWMLPLSSVPADGTSLFMWPFQAKE